MKQSPIHILRGYLEVRLTGFMPERFLNLCKKNEIEIWNLRYERDKNSWIFLADLPDYRRIRPYVKKSGVHLEIIRKLGLPFFLYRNRRRKMYVTGIVTFLAVLFLMTRFVWNISLEGNEHFSDDTLLTYLKENQIVYGMRKSRVDCNALEEQMRETFPEILWVSARISGTRLLIHIKENQVFQKIPETDEEPADLISDVDGTITHMIVRQGRAAVHEGDAVVKGQLLVSGQILIRDDSENVVDEKQVKADADICARTERRIRVPFSTRVLQRTDTGKTRNGVMVEVGPYCIQLLFPVSETDIWRIMKERRQITLLGDFYLPIWITRITAAEYQSYERTMTQDEENRMIEKFQKEIEEKFREKGVVIIQNDVKILDRPKGRAAEYHFILEEPAAKAQKLTEPKENEQPDECN